MKPSSDHINYKALSQHPRLNQLSKELKAYPTAWRVGIWVIILLSGVGLLLLIVGIIQLSLGNDGAGLVLMGLFFVVASIISSKDFFKELIKNTQLKSFAQNNDFLFGFDETPTDYPGVYFSKGLVLVSDRIRSKEENFFELGNFRLIGRRDRSSSSPTFGYVRIRIPRALPNILLASKVASQNNPLPVALDTSQRLSLEGNFNDIFTLYVPKGYEQDALYIFTPDVMVKFMDLFGDFNAEIVDNEIYFYSSKKLDLTKQETVESTLILLEEFFGKFLKQAGNYRGSTVQPLETQTSSVSAEVEHEVIANAGRRLRASRLQRIAYGLLVLLLLGLGIFGIVVLIQQSSQSHGTNASVFRIFASLGIVAAVSFLIGLIRVLINRKRLRNRNIKK
jgi:hypothetical protein